MRDEYKQTLLDMAIFLICSEVLVLLVVAGYKFITILLK